MRNSQERILNEGGFCFTVVNGKATILRFPAGFTDLHAVPDKVGGFPVAAIADGAFGWPDPQPQLFRDGEGEHVADDGVIYDVNMTEIKSVPDDLRVLVIPAGVKGFRNGACPRPFELEAVRVEEGSLSFASADGMLFNSDMTELILVPEMMEGVCRIPASVTKFGAGAGGFQPLLRAFEVAPVNEFFRSVDGVVYTKDLDRLLLFPEGRDGYLSIPEGVLCVDMCGFSDCPHLTGVRFPSSVTEILGPGGFDYCGRLAAIDVDEGNPRYRSVCGVLFNRDMTELIRFPEGKGGLYAVPDTVISIAERAFAGCMLVERIEVPSSVANLGLDAFKGCEDMVVRKRAGELAEGVFRYVAEAAAAVLTGVDDIQSGTVAVPRLLGGLPVAGVAERVFEGCEGVRSVLIPETVSLISDNAFRGCGGLAEISVAADNLRYRSFDGMLFDKDRQRLVWCPGSKEGVARIPVWAILMGSKSFSGCAGLTGFEVDPGNPRFRSFDGVLMNKEMTDVVRCPEGKAGGFRVPAGVEWFWSGAFDGCDRLSSLTVPKGKKSRFSVQLSPSVVHTLRIRECGPVEIE